MHKQICEFIYKLRKEGLNMNFKKIKKFFTLSRRQDGFTLVELIVVIAILAILGGVAVPAYSGYVKKADRAADEALLVEINTAFASACSLNGENYFLREDTDLDFQGGKSVMGLKIGVPKVAEDFGLLFESEEVEFKSINPKQIMYVKAEGRFREAKMLTYMDSNGRTYNISEKYRDQFVNSVWTENFTTEELMKAIDDAVTFAAGRPGILGNILQTDEFKELYKATYGKDAPASVDGLSEAERTDLMRTMVLYVGQNTQNVETDDVYNDIVSNKGSMSYTGSNAAGAEGDTEDITKIAMHYAAGLAWAKDSLNNGETTQAQYDAMVANPQAMFDAMGPQQGTDEKGRPTTVDSDFVKWMEENPEAAKEAMDGYAGAVGMVGDNTGNVKGEDLADGFANSDSHKELIEEVKGKEQS
jgi:prepilin-type N-terminal cleavage/methylation domain-containing protein